jgi:hypothetical protein|tara:strand:+ start:383 stop:508 length:126 start_codon:yes stop_codon:yes gene_type:complete
MKKKFLECKNCNMHILAVGKSLAGIDHRCGNCFELLSEEKA